MTVSPSSRRTSDDTPTDARPAHAAGRPVVMSPRAVSPRVGWVVVALAVCLAQTGCVYRRMTVRSDPPGALVMVDGQEIGYTPVSVDFTYYGTREITLVKDGYETLTVMQKLQTPWYQYPGIEFFADNLWPHKITNRHDFLYKLQPQTIVPTQELIDRANSLRSDIQVRPRP